MLAGANGGLYSPRAAQPSSIAEHEHAESAGIFDLLAANDDHAKNFSIFLTPGGYRLTPLYDVMSAAPYPEFPIQKVKLAMAFGDKGYYRLSQIQRRHFYQTGQKAGLHEQDMESISSELASRIEDAIAEGRVRQKQQKAAMMNRKGRHDTGSSDREVGPKGST